MNSQSSQGFSRQGFTQQGFTLHKKFDEGADSIYKTLCSLLEPNCAIRDLTISDITLRAIFNNNCRNYDTILATIQMIWPKPGEAYDYFMSIGKPYMIVFISDTRFISDKLPRNDHYAVVRKCHQEEHRKTWYLMLEEKKTHGPKTESYRDRKGKKVATIDIEDEWGNS